MFLMNHDGLNNLCRRSPRKRFCQVILKSVQCFLTRRLFLSFQSRYTGKISTRPPPPPPPPWRPCFLTNHDSFNNLGSGSPKEYFCKIILKSVQWFLTTFLKLFFFFFWLPRQLEFCMDSKSLNNFQSVSLEAQSCEILLNWLSS